MSQILKQGQGQKPLVLKYTQTQSVVSVGSTRSLLFLRLLLLEGVCGLWCLSFALRHCVSFLWVFILTLCSGGVGYNWARVVVALEHNYVG